MSSIFLASPPSVWADRSGGTRTLDSVRRRLVKYDFGELDEVSLAYAVTIHKSQGSEFPAVVMPVAMQHYMLLQRNLIYTGITRAKRLLVLVGQKKALGIAGRNDQSRKRYSGLLSSLKT
jgi:exodeoxyribonuclease V alpha subunit